MLLLLRRWDTGHYEPISTYCTQHGSPLLINFTLIFVAAIKSEVILSYLALVFKENLVGVR